MSRIDRLPTTEWDPSLRALTKSEIGIMPVLAHNPGVAKGVAELYKAMGENRALPRRLLELVRLRIGYRNQCRTCIAVRYGDDIEADLDEGAVCALEKPLESDLLSPAEKAAIVFADRMATDHLGADDAMFDELRRHFTTPEMIELCVAVSTYIGFGRLAAALHMVEVLPEEYARDQDGLFAPWLNTGVNIAR